MAANVMFKRGLYKDLANAAKVDGHIYVTTDEHAMYVDYTNQTTGSVERIRLGDVIEVEKFADLPDFKVANTAALYYVHDGNMLLKSNGPTADNWAQLNAQQTITDLIGGLQATVEVDSNVATITTNVLSNLNTATGQSAIIKMASADNEALNITTGENSVIQLRGKNVDTVAKMAVSSEAGGVVVAINTEVDGTAADGSTIDNDIAGGSVRFEGFDGTTVSYEDGKILIGGGSVTSVEHGFDENGEYTFSVTAPSGKKTSAGVTPTIKYGTNEQAVFANGEAVLSVYSKSETDTAISDALKANNAMTFKGALDAEHGLPTEGVAIGDTYKVALAGTYGEEECIVGDMLIATASEGAVETNGVLDPADVKWIYIPSGNEDIVTYSAQHDADDNGHLVFTNDSNQQMAKISGGTDITIAKGTGIGAVVVNHNVHNGTATTATAAAQVAQQEFVINPVVSMTLSNGHIDSYATQEIKLYDTHNDISEVNHAVTVNTVSEQYVATIETEVKTTDTTAKSDSFALASQSLVLEKKTDNQVNIEMQWGSF